MSAFTYQVIFNWIAVLFYIASTIFFAYATSFRKIEALKPAVALLVPGLVFHIVALAIRWHIAGHGPYMARYEILSSIAWVTIFMFLLVALRYPGLRLGGVIIVPIAFLIAVVGLFIDPQIRRLPPSLRSIWLVIHIAFNKLAAGAIIVAFGTSVLYLLKEKHGDKGVYANVPSLEVLDAYSHKFIGFGFIFWSITIAAGAIWANEAWGRYWGWDPIETWALITWLLYGFYLHSRYFLHWQGRRAAYLMAICFILSLFTIFFIPFVAESLHTEYFR